MRSAWIVETGGLAAPAEIRLEETQVTGAAADLFATGYAALLAGEIETAVQAAKRIDGRKETASHGPMCDMSAGYDSTTQRDLLVADVLRNSLRALIALERGTVDEALLMLDEATAIEEAMPLDFGPPIIVKPSHEIYGEVLLRLDRPADARVQFEKALARAPRRSLSLAGLARASRAEGNSVVTARACAEIAEIYEMADESVAAPGVCPVRRGAVEAGSGDS
jgi:predicted Zn-dependent protease